MRGRVLVTGARGFIGRRCLPALAARGFEVEPVSSADCDLRDPAAAQALIERSRPSHLLHLAWIARPGEFWQSPENRAWLASGVQLVEAFYTHGGVRAVGVGSCAEYADTSEDCTEEGTPLEPATPYGEAKKAMFLALREAAHGRGWAWARLFFPYGEGEPRGRFIPSLIEGLIAGVPVECTHGAQVRDFVHVEDVAEACATLVAGEASGAYNVGTGRGASLREVAAETVAQLGHGELVRFGARPAPAHDPARVVANTAKMRREHRWQARIALSEGLSRTIAARKARAEQTQ
jgi:nucleoside-diphosphate-sugar epimerase